MSVGSPGASRVVGIARVGGLCVHGVCNSDQAAGPRGGNTEAARLDAVHVAVELEALKRLTEVASCWQSGLNATLGAPGEETPT